MHAYKLYIYKHRMNHPMVTVTGHTLGNLEPFSSLKRFDFVRTRPAAISIGASKEEDMPS